MSAFDYWASGAGLDQVTPQGKAWPEGDDFPRFLAELIGPRKVLEFGCGPGRLVGAFDSSQYVGVDICKTAIERAKVAYPAHEFCVIGQDDPLPESEVTLCHTVLLHVPDEELSTVIARFKSPVVLVSEIMGRQWRRDGDPPVFNRDGIDYALAFGAAGYGTAGKIERPYPHYRNTNLTILEFRRGPVLDPSSPARSRRARG